MATSVILSLSHFFLTCLIAFFCFSNKLCFCFKHKYFNLSIEATHWSSSGATWYGSPNGAGSDGGACGYGNTVSQAPFSSVVTGIGPSLYNSGKECGACYKVKCTPLMFWQFLVKKKLRDAGVLNIQYARVACDYGGKTITFHVDQGSNPNYFAVVIEFEEGDGDLTRVGLKEPSKSGAADEWRGMQQSWGAIWKLDTGSELKAPFSIKLISQYSGQTLVAKDVIPNGWKPGAIYRSLVNYL